ncbi:MAG: RHS repeat-associated core domain-containing protein [Desulfobacterales bacterium]
MFTSNASSPAPGDWKGIYFRNFTNDSQSLLEHCVIEFAGHTNNANIYLNNAKPTLQYNTIRNSSHSGIYVNGTGSNGAAINCNNLKDNHYGVYTISDARPVITGNNFLRNLNAGVYNASGVTVVAENNWWNDPNGANFNGDDASGTVDFTPWLMAASDCITTPPTNTPPFAPKSPNPANGAVRVPAIDGILTVSWLGGDPNPWDTVTYDVYFGDAADNLIIIYTDTDVTSAQMSGLLTGTTYYWQVVARDNTGAETQGPVWHFTTDGPPSDLVVADVTWAPAENLAAGQTITFTAAITNTGTGPVVDAFQVAFKIDGVSIGSASAGSIFQVGESVQVTRSWTAKAGDHNLEVTADSGGKVSESDESNNTLFRTLPTIIDPTPPVMTGSNPIDGAFVQTVNQIRFTLVDQYGVVDDAAVIASVTVLGGGQLLSGTVLESNDQFTFVPSTAPLPDGVYQVALTAADVSGNTQVYSFAFTVDQQPPAAPVITGGAVATGVIRVRPFDNRSNTAVITLTGTRDADTGVWVDNIRKVDVGSGDWSVALNLPQGANALEIWVQDTAGNRSYSVWVDMLVDSVAPSITSITPENNSFLNVPPDMVVVGFTEATTSLNLDDSTRALRDAGLNVVPGTWSVAGGNQLVFAPPAPLPESTYTLELQLEDELGNRGAAVQYRFAVDTTKPPTPAIDPVTSPTHNPSQIIGGSKEEYTAILLDGQQIIGNTGDATWQHTVALTNGMNNFAFAAKDRAGNQSEAVNVGILFDDVAPDPVATLTAYGEGDGRTVYLDWTGYNEAVHGDIASYRVYVGSAPFADVTGLTAYGTATAGHFTATVEGLAKGITYWFAVVAVDTRGNTDPAVTAVPGIPVDKVPPENVTNLRVSVSENDRLVFNWTHSADTFTDLAGYRVYFGEETTAVDIPAAVNSYERSGLSPGSAYLLRISSFDGDGNASSGAAATGYTLLANPAGLAPQPYSGYVDLTWNAAAPAEYFKTYRVYVSQVDFTSVTGMAPVVTTTAAAVKVAGLTNNVPYFFAVTAVNKSDGEQKAVTTVTATPVADTEGPELSNVMIENVPLVSGYTLTRPATVSLDAADPAGVSRVEFLLDGAPVRTDYSAPYTGYLNIVPLADGAHNLQIAAYDTLNNVTMADYTLNVALEVPLAPMITQPGSGVVTNKPTVTVSGHAEKGTEVRLYNNGIETGQAVAVDALGNFGFTLTLVEGENRIRAAARYPDHTGLGPLSTEVLVTLDTTLPYAPTALTAQAKEGGVVKLSWQPPTETAAAGTNLYRAQTSFGDVGEAVKINVNLITAASFSDLPPEDGTWNYRATTVDTAGNESEPSPEATAVSDATAPRAAAVVYAPQGRFDPETGAMAPGTVDMVLTVSEPLQTAPYLSIAPEGGTPIPVSLSRDTDLTYTGFFVIAENTPTGAAYAIFSARDVVGNRGTEIDAGAVIEIDTDGPTVKRLAVVPEDPIQNDQQNPVSVTLSLGLTEAVKSGDVPQLSYLLSGAGRSAVAVDSLTEVATQPGDAQSWQAAFSLPADAGLVDAETIHFVYQGTDELSNVGDRIAAPNLFQVYQGDLPPLAPPLNFAGMSLPGGRIRLNWEAVEEAVGYQLFRQAPGESELTAYQRIEGALEYVDQPGQDGLYTYAIASIRSENGQEALSGLSDPVTVVSDSVPPLAPTEFTLELVANGIKCTWQPPVYTEPITYILYRATSSEITSVEGLAPLAAGIEQSLVVDPHPSPAAHCYTVTAVDAAGNQSSPAVSAYLNFQLLPVSGITVVQADAEAPIVTWTHPGGSIAGYDIYLGTQADGVKLNVELLAEQSYTDVGWAGDERRYTVVAVDTNGAESLGRSIALPLVEAHYSPESLVRRGVMNRLTYTVENGSTERVENIRLKADLAGHLHTSDKFGIDAGQSTAVPMVVGGFSNLPDLASVSTTVEVTPGTGETVRIVRSSQVDVADGMLAVQILNEEFTRGASGTVRFTVENTGEEEIEVVTAKNSGNSASDQVLIYLLDEDDNVIATRAFKQAVGDMLVTLSNKNTVARIPAGATFTSAPLGISVPANAPDNITIKLSIANIYYHQGQETHVKMAGLATTHPVTLVDTTYYGEIVSITPESATGGQDISIVGRAVERATDTPLADVPLNLVITLNGFERKYAVFAGIDGTFAHVFKPPAGESGIYKVRAVHPDLTDKPVMGQFVITRLSVTPTTINLTQPKNYTKTIGIKVTTGEGTVANNLHLEYNATDQPAGDYPQGVHLTVGSPVTALSAKTTATLNFTIFADNTAAATETLQLKVISDEGSWGTVTINAGFSDAKPVLYFSPDHVETGVARNNTVTESVVLENRGLAAMNGVTLSLVNPDGSPAPDWVVLNSTGSLGDLQVGQKQQVAVAFSPTASVAEGVYTFKLRVTSANYPARDINLYVSVTQSGVGGVLFKVADIYTGTFDASQQIVQGLAGAKVRLQNEAVLTEEYNKTTDSLGEAFFEELPAGRYKARVTAVNHQEVIGRVWVKPGVTVVEDVFLDVNLVTVEWSVTETTIQDKYDIVLSAIYETNVPAAVVAVEPISIVLPRMRAGDVYNGEIALVNYGLIRAEALSFNLPGSDRNFKFELLSGSLPEAIEAKERIVIPYRVTCLQSLDQEEGGTGGGCSRYVRCMTVDYGYMCTNGKWTNSSARHCWTYSYGDCAGTAGVTVATGGGGTWNLGTGTGGGSTSSPAPAPRTIEGVKCFPEPKRKESFCSTCYLKGERKNFIQNVFSSVNLVMREYFLEESDLAIKVPGGSIEAKRWYYGGRWHWEHKRHNLIFKLDALGQRIETIDKGGVIYEAVAANADVFTHEFYRIVRTGTGWRWEHKNGEYKLFDATGRQTEYGNRTGVIGSLLYEPGESGKLIGVTDRGGSQVLWFEYSGNQITAVTDAVGRRVEYGFTGSLLTSVTDVAGGITRFEYDGQGRIDKKIDPENYASTITYDKYAHVSAVNDAAGLGYLFEYDMNEGTKETYVRITAPGGAIREIWYNRDGEPTRVDLNGRTIEKIARDGRDLIITDEKGRVTRKNYDEWDNLTRVLYPDGTFVSYEYEHTFSRRIRETDENGVTTAYVYDGIGNMIQKIDAVDTADERITTYTYDAEGNPLTTARLADADTPTAETVMAYDTLGNVISITDPEGGVTRFTSHDIMGNVLTKEDARGKLWQYVYDAAGRLEKTIDPLGQTTRFFYDKKGNKVQEVDAQNREALFEYDQHGNLLRRTDSLGNATVFTYNADGKLLSQTDAEGKVVCYEYDADGRLVKTVDGNGNEIVMEYDEATGAGCSSCSGGGAKDQPARIIYPTFEKLFSYDKRGRKVLETEVAGGESYVSIFGYDDAGNLMARTDKEEKTTAYVYDDLNRLKTVTDALLGETGYAYDSRDNLKVLTDAKNQTTWFEYDRNNRLLKEIRPEGQETTYAYDAAGNLVQKIDAKNQKTVYEYDDAGRLAEIRYFTTANDNAPLKTVTFTYDRTGVLTGYEDGTTSAIYTYDDLNRKIGETVNYGPFALTNSYTYYNNGLKESFTGPDSVTYRYTYDAANQLTGVEIPGQGTITYSSYTWNRPDEVILPGGSRRQYVYDPLMRVKSITAKDPGQNVVMSYQYTYDKMDNITAKATDHGPYEYGYDDLYRLTNADNPVQANEAYSYDGVGNRLTSVEHSDWSYGNNNELQGYDGVMFLYDANGNTIEKNSNGNITKYFYNIEDRLVRVEDGIGTVIAAYYYDPFGRRLWKEVDGVRTYFVYSDEGLVGKYGENGMEIKTYGYKPGSTWTTDPLFVKEAGHYYFYQNDRLGTPQKMIGINGALVWSGKYSSFGKADIDDSPSVTNNLRFAGQYYDNETGLHYNWHRYYDPKAGKYLRADPFGLAGGINSYAYVQNNPVKLIDPLGLIDFHYYKRWGGPGWTAGAKRTWDTMPEALREDIRRQIRGGWDPLSKYKPLDDQDTCYMHHDICCGETRMNCRGQEGCYDECLLPKKNKCDRELVNCLIGIGIMGKSLDEARRIAAIPVFVFRPAANNAIAENKKKGTNWWLRFEF